MLILIICLKFHNLCFHSLHHAAGERLQPQKGSDNVTISTGQVNSVLNTEGVTNSIKLCYVLLNFNLFLIAWCLTLMHCKIV